MAIAQSTQAELRKLANSLPRGSSLNFTVDDNALWINRIFLPPSARQGAGSRLLARILEIGDRAGLPIMLEANPTDRPGDPETYDLVRWYTRFGFQRLTANEDGVLMRRDPAPRRPWTLILADAKAAHCDLDQGAFVTWQEAQLGIAATGTPLDETFSPRLVPCAGLPGQFDYEDGKVWGSVALREDAATGMRVLDIFEWNSVDPGKGHADRALRWLRQRADLVEVRGIGEIDEDGPDITVVYWRRQHEKGLVDRLWLDNGTALDMGPPGTLTIVRGHQGSGKSTWSAALAASNPGMRHLEQDQFLERDGEYRYDPVRHAAGKRWCLAATEQALACGHDVVVAATFTSLAELEPYLALPASSHRVVEMKGDFPNVHGVPEEVVAQRKSQFQPYPGAQVVDPRPAPGQVLRHKAPRA